VKRPRIREEDEAVAREQAEHRREVLLERLKAQEAAARKPADVPAPDEPLPDGEDAPAATEPPPAN